MTTETPTAEPFDAFEQRLASAFAAEATTVVAPADGLDRIHARVVHRRRARRATWVAAAAALVLLAGFVGIALRPTDSDSSPYVETDTDGPELIRTPDVMAADWAHPNLLVPDGSQWRVQDYSPWARYSVDAVVQDEDGPRHVTLTVEVDGDRDVVAESWPSERREAVEGGDAVLTADSSLRSSILWHPEPGITAELSDTTAADTAFAALDAEWQRAMREWGEAGGVGEAPEPAFRSAGSIVPVPVDDATAARLVRMASALVPVDRATWLQALDDSGVVLLTGAGPVGPVAAPLASNAGTGSPRITLPAEEGRTLPRFTPNMAMSYRFDVDGFPEATFLLELSVHHDPPPGIAEWEPVQVQTQGGFGGPPDPMSPIFSPATVRGVPGEFEHYSITTLDRTDPTHTRSLRWVSDGYDWRLRFLGAASGDDAIEFANSLVIPDAEQWEAMVFPARPPTPEPELAFELRWLQATGRYVPCEFGQICD
jgi:hypothetical protein